MSRLELSSFDCSFMLEQLADRLVPANVVDLTYVGAEGSAGGALFRQVDDQPTGTGFIDSFVRLQTNQAIERGYNTDFRPLEFHENNSPQFTRSITVGEVPRVRADGSLYREFFLDINQRASKPLLSLDEVVIFLADEPNLTGYDPTAKTLAGAERVFDLDATGDSWVKLDYSLNSGSGSGDMTMLIPAALLGNDPTKFVYLFSSLGLNHSNNGGFEEWAVRESTPDEPPPVEPSSLSGFVFEDLNDNGLLDGDDIPIFAARITLTGVNDLGEPVEQTVMTGDDGSYAFTDLRPGTYSISEEQPAGYDDDDDFIGTQGGSVANDLLYDIILGEDVDGINNNFTDRFSNPNS